MARARPTGAPPSTRTRASAASAPALVQPRSERPPGVPPPQTPVRAHRLETGCQAPPFSSPGKMLRPASRRFAVSGARHWGRSELLSRLSRPEQCFLDFCCAIFVRSPPDKQPHHHGKTRQSQSDRSKRQNLHKKASAFALTSLPQSGQIREPIFCLEIKFRALYGV